MREDKIVRLESLMDGVLLKEDFLEDEIASLRDENKVLIKIFTFTKHVYHAQFAYLMLILHLILLTDFEESI